MHDVVWVLIYEKNVEAEVLSIVLRKRNLDNTEFPSALCHQEGAGSKKCQVIAR